MSENQPNMFKLQDDGNPFANREDAQRYIKAKELDPANFIPRKYQGGWAVLDLNAATEQDTTAKMVDQPAEKYFQVEFNPTGGANDFPHVQLQVNNWDIRIQRGKPVVLPERFVECARNAVQTNYVPDESAKGVGRQPMKAQGTIMRYQFRIIREATKKEFEEGLASGNTIQNSWLQDLKRAAP